jgi:hypothetical protein
MGNWSIDTTVSYFDGPIFYFFFINYISLNIPMHQCKHVLAFVSMIYQTFRDNDRRHMFRLIYGLLNLTKTCFSPRLTAAVNIVSWAE